MKLPFQAPFMVLTRRYLAAVLSLFLAFWTGAISVPQATRAAGVDTGSRATTGSIADCSDSGILVALSGTHQELGHCPLKHTDVRASVSGYVARVTVRQQFHNPFNEKIEAVYTFPLPSDAAVDDMTMKVGNRVIKGAIKKREEARRTYEAARARGNVASLLDQERPNIFTQSVANIEPGENIDIEIKYVNLLKYEDGAFTFIFPTVVGPRFIPGHSGEGKTGTGVAQNTDIVPDASRITPPMAHEGQRAGHDISIEMNINAGVPIQSVSSKLHDVDIQRTGQTTAHIKLKDRDKIPNKDFIATWNVAADSVQSGYLTHRQGNDGFFTLMLIPPKRVTPETVQPKEMIFLIDCSGSQRGRPIQKAKETMKYILDHMNPNDTFQIITFNNTVELFPEHRQVASAAMKEKAVDFIYALEAHGGTWMAPAIEAACALPNEEHRLRIITYMTDGYVGNDFEIISMIKKHRDKTRWFSFGTGNSVNRFLIDNIAKEGGGEADYVLLNSSAQEVGKKFYDRISSPVLTDLKVEFKGVETKEVFPKDLADLWAQRPLYFTGRYLKAGKGKVILSGYSAGKRYKQEMNLDFPASQDSNEVLPSIWARAKVERLMSEDWYAVQSGSLNKELKDEIVETSLKYHIMSQYTSFVAVEEDRKTSGDKAKLVPVPVETPQGVQMEQQQRLIGYNGMQHHASIAGPWQAQMVFGGTGSGSGAGKAPQPSAIGGGWSDRTYITTGRHSAKSSGAPASSWGGYVESGSAEGLPPTAMGKSIHVQAPSWGGYTGSGSTGGLPPTTLDSFVKNAASDENSVANQNSVVSSQMQHDERATSLRQHHGHYGSGSYAPSVSAASSVPSSVPVSGALLSKRKNAQAIQEKPLAGEFKDNGNEQSANSQQEHPESKEKTSFHSAAKIDRRLQSVLEKISRGENTAKLVEGKILIHVELAATPDADLLQRLKSLGFNLVKRSGRFVVGRIEPKDLDNLAKLAVVIQIKLD